MDTVTVTFDAGAVVGSHSLKLTATSSVDSDWDSGNVTVAEFLAVNVESREAAVFPAPSTVDTVTFAVRFPGRV